MLSNNQFCTRDFSGNYFFFDAAHWGNIPQKWNTSFLLFRGYKSPFSCVDHSLLKRWVPVVSLGFYDTGVVIQDGLFMRQGLLVILMGLTKLYFDILVFLLSDRRKRGKKKNEWMIRTVNVNQGKLSPIQTAYPTERWNRQEREKRCTASYIQNLFFITWYYTKKRYKMIELHW